MPPRWQLSTMQARGQRLFKQMYRKKRLSHANHDIHFLARSIDGWLPSAVKSLVNGTYCPQDLKRHYFEDDTVDSLSIPEQCPRTGTLHDKQWVFCPQNSNVLASMGNVVGVHRGSVVL